MLHAIEKNESALPPEGLQLFFNQWHAINTMDKPDVHSLPLAGQLRDFFDEWPHKYTQPKSPPTKIEIDAKKLEQFFIKFKEEGCPAILKMRRTGDFSNVWRAAGLKRDELRNSAVLAWLLDRHGDHGQGSAILERLLQLLPTYFPNLDKEFPNAKNAEGNYWTYTESCPLGEKENRVDIEIDGREFLLFIEVKIGAQETNKQLDRYLGIGSYKAQGRPWGVLYLTRDGHLPDRFADEHPELVPIKWKWVASILEAYTKGQSSFASHFIRQFADHIRTF